MQFGYYNIKQLGIIFRFLNGKLPPAVKPDMREPFVNIFPGKVKPVYIRVIFKIVCIKLRFVWAVYYYIVLAAYKFIFAYGIVQLTAFNIKYLIVAATVRTNCWKLIQIKQYVMSRAGDKKRFRIIGKIDLAVWIKRTINYENNNHRLYDILKV